MRDMRQDQRALAFGLLSAGLSHDGFVTATQIMSLEQVLWELESVLLPRPCPVSLSEIADSVFPIPMQPFPVLEPQWLSKVELNLEVGEFWQRHSQHYWQ